MARIVKPGGKVFVTVWAKEQPRFAGEENQDAMVSWKYQAHQPQKMPKKPRERKNKKHNPPAGTDDASSSSQAVTESSALVQTTAEEKPVIYQRYYHLFYKGELDGLFGKIPCLTIDFSGEQVGNYYIEATKH